MAEIAGDEGSAILRMPAITQTMFRQLNSSLVEKSREAGVLEHKLEQGLATEQAVRAVLREFLPGRYGVAKGKVINRDGALSRHCDVIIYDALYCPTFFVDESNNQVIPAEGVFEIVEIKSTLNAARLREAFDGLASVYEVADQRATVRSTNSLVDYRPPPWRCWLSELRSWRPS